jgi:membrane protease YdiL (CAAX protease family)
MKNLVSWKMFFTLLVACVVSSMLVIPYTLTLTSNNMEMTPVMLLLSVVQNIFLFALVIFFGLLLSKRIGIGLPILQGFIEGKNRTKELKLLLIPSICIGFFAGLLIILISIPFGKFVPELQNSEVSIPAWKTFLASFYGGIAEEVLLRLFLMSLIVWTTFKIKKSKDGNPTVFGIWLSIVLSAIIFGLGHLPTTAQITALTGLVIIRAIVLNASAGIIFGWLYWKKGLESAMIAHFSTDIVLHVITPFVISFFA